MARELPSGEHYNFLQAIIRKCEGDPKILILSSGNRPGGAERPRMVQRWADKHGFYNEFNCTNPHDKASATSCAEERKAIASFIDRHRTMRDNIVIFHQGHGCRGSGAWKGGVTPEEVSKMADGGNITVVTGACFGGAWLNHFDGVTATSSELPAPGHGEFWPWLFREGPFPSQRTPMQRGLGRALFPDAHESKGKTNKLAMKASAMKAGINAAMKSAPKPVKKVAMKAVVKTSMKGEK